MPSSVSQRLSQMEWTSPTSFTLAGLSFALEDLGLNYEGGDAFTVMKPAHYFDAYGQVLGEFAPANVMELGIRTGGSTVFFTALLQPEKMVSIDICKTAAALERFRAEHPDGRRVSTHYRTSQDDERKLADILAREMDGPLDLVIDDASHDYDLSRSSFEILFPRLRPGGCYVIEDWQWAHQPGVNIWKDKPALSNLVFQLMMVCAGRPDLVAKIQVFPGIAFVMKGPSAASEDRLDVDSLCWMQGRSFSLL
jgi:SAM-dependent methyltransferase